MSTLYTVYFIFLNYFIILIVVHREPQGRIVCLIVLLSINNL